MLNVNSPSANFLLNFFFIFSSRSQIAKLLRNHSKANACHFVHAPPEGPRPRVRQGRAPPLPPSAAAAAAAATNNSSSRNYEIGEASLLALLCFSSLRFNPLYLRRHMVFFLKGWRWPIPVSWFRCFCCWSSARRRRTRCSFWISFIVPRARYALPSCSTT